MLEQQWHHVVKFLDVLDAFGVRQFLEHGDTVAQVAETPLQSGQLQCVDLLGGHLFPVLQVVLDQGHRVAQ
ncbi:hypothetical protein D3C85_1927030 [compost metagenome]